MSDRDLEFFEEIAALKRQGRRFAVATVVSRRSPVSSHLGDRAVILADGHMSGFVGGACSREIVRRQALECLGARSPRLVQIRPEGAPEGFIANASHVVIPMSCASEGAVDVYIEPYTQPPLLLIAGFSPVAESLARMAPALEWDCVRLLSAEEAADLPPGGPQVVILDGLDGYLVALAQAGRPLDAVIVASQGHYDEVTLEAVLRASPGYIGLLASRKRAAVVREVLIDGGISAEAAAAIHNPAGLNVGAITPGEVAISIIAEIVQCRSAASSMVTAATETTAPATSIDPVCNMEVEIATARHRAEYQGTTYYFCCPACKRSFERNPATYLNAVAAT